MAKTLTWHFEDGDVDASHEAWSRLPEAYVETLRGTTIELLENKIKKQPCRTLPLVFRASRITQPTDSKAEPTTIRQRQLINLRNRCVEVAARIARWRRQNPDWDWGLDPGNSEVEQSSSAIWKKIKDTGPKLLGKQIGNREQAFTGTTPSVDLLEAVIQETKKTYEAEQNGLDRERAKTKRAQQRWDHERNFSRKAFRRVRANYAPPTMAIRDPAKDGEFTFDQARVHTLFMQDWATVYRRRGQTPPDVNHFQQTFGSYVPSANSGSLYSNQKRYFKVGGSYGAVIAQANGCPQGCSFSLFLANIYVSALFNFLEDKHPGVRLGAFIDDRNVRHKSADELASVLADVCRFDQAAGHTTNILKSTVFANTVDNRRKLKHINIDGNKPRNVLDETMVGHTILVKRTTTSATAKMNMRQRNRSAGPDTLPELTSRRDRSAD